MAFMRHEAKQMFDYQTLPIDPRRNQIRLLELYPGRPEDGLAGRLYVVSLDDMPQYDALSYCWGSRSDTLLDLTLGDSVTLILRNLYSALRDIRRPSTSIALWVDAICIDQTNSKERGDQIEKMRRIYAGAQVVRAWVDYELDENSEIIQELPKIDVNEVEALRPNDLQFWSPVVGLLQNTYWRRLWVQQELVLAREIAICCRTRVLDPQLVQWLIDIPQELYILSSKMGRLRFHILNDLMLSGLYMDLYRRASVTRSNLASQPLSCLQFLTVNFERECLLALFTRTHLLEVSESRDRVYGLLGIALDYDIGDIAVDYKLTVAQVYSQIAEMYIRKHRSLIFLCYYRLSHNRGQESYPTWRPDPEKMANIMWTFIEAWTLSRLPSTADTAYVHSDGMALSARGVCVDRISWVPAEVDFSKIPIRQWIEELGIGQSGCGIEEEEGEQVLHVLFPKLLNARYSQWHLTRPDKATQLSAVKKLLDVVNSSKSPAFSLDDIFYGDFDLSDVATAQELEAFRCIRHTLLLEKFFKTSKGYIGLIDYKARVQNNDEVWVLEGCPLPVLLRPYSSRLGGGYTRVVCIESMPALMEENVSAGQMENAEPESWRQGLLVQQIDIW